MADQPMDLGQAESILRQLTKDHEAAKLAWAACVAVRETQASLAAVRGEKDKLLKDVEALKAAMLKAQTDAELERRSIASDLAQRKQSAAAAMETLAGQWKAREAEIQQIGQDRRRLAEEHDERGKALEREYADKAKRMAQEHLIQKARLDKELSVVRDDLAHARFAYREFIAGLPK